MSNVIHLQHACTVTPSGPESTEAAVREVSAHIAGHIAGQRSGHSRLDELKTGALAVRRSHPRAPSVVPLRPLTFYSIEEAEPAEYARALRRA